MGNEFIKNIKYLFKCVLSLIYSTSNSCILCEEDVQDDKLLCKNCRKQMIISNNNVKIKGQDYIFDCYSALYYSRSARKLILRLKYKNDFRAAIPIVEHMINTINIYNIKFDVVTYVPSSKEALKKRGYNQSEYLAKLIGEAVKSDVVNVLEKIKKTEDQIGLDKNQRWENLNGSFKCKNVKKVAGKRVLIVDDVLTTGATAFHCAKEIMLEGAKDVIIITSARGVI